MIDEKDVSIVWFSRIVKNAKATLRSDIDHYYRYFDVTYFGEEGAYIDTTLDLEDWQEAVKLAHELALTPLNERGGSTDYDWIKMAKRALQLILGRG